VTLTEDQLLLLAREHPDEVIKYLDEQDKKAAEQSFAEFVKQAWHVLDPATKLVWGWVMDAICDHLQAVHSGDLQKVLINVPPGTCKTLLTCVFFPAWEWGPRNQPHQRYIKATYSETFSIDANTKLRRLVKSDWYRERWGDRVQITDDQDSKTYFGNTATGWCMAISVGGQLIGYRGTRFIIDDPHNTLKAESDVDREKAVKWYFDGTSTRHNDPANPVEIIIMQRLHEHDISGAILAHARYYGFEHLCIEMEFDPNHPVARKRPSRIAWVDPRCSLDEANRLGALCFPERYPREAVENLKEKFRQGEEGILYAEAGQLQQWPVSRKGGMFDVEKVEVKPLHELGIAGMKLAGRVVRGWDLAGSTRKTSPFTAGVAMMRLGHRIVILDVVRDRWDADVLDHHIGEQADRDDVTYGLAKQDLPQDPGQAGKAQVAHFASGPLAGHAFTTSTETKEGKELRAIPFASQVGAGLVTLVEAPWNKAYLAEMRMFPAGRFKDQIDASSRAYAALLQIKEVAELAGGTCIDLTAQDDGSWAMSDGSTW
jgi:predicted phage terminase large subunit-like protein